MSHPNLFIATDGHELCLWEGERSDPQPRCVERESDVDPIVWSLIVAAVDAIEAERPFLSLPGRVA